MNINKILKIILIKISPLIKSDVLFLKLYYRLSFHRSLNLLEPKTFNEKLQWLKLYNRKIELSNLVDKYAVKEIVAKKIGSEYIIPTIGVWDNPENIDFSKLPNQFVLKTTNGGGGFGVVICKDISQFDINESVSILRKAQRIDLYKLFREWPYKHVKSRIIAEQYIEDSNGELPDYKFYCFHGKMEFMFIATGRFSGYKTFDYYDKDFNKMNIEWGAPSSSISMKKPIFFDEMKEIAETLSKDLPHARIDLFNADGKIYFGEVTFFDGCGFTPFSPDEWDYKIGDLLDLSKVVRIEE